MENIYLRQAAIEAYHLSRTIPEEILRDYCQKVIDRTFPKKLCDIGFGKGSTLIPFSEINGIEVCGIDSSKGMCEFVRNELKTRNLRAKIINQDANRLSLLVSGLDIVHLKGVTHIPASPHDFLDNVSKAIPSGGHFVIGKEFSQPEDNLECIDKYRESNSEDSILKDFYDTYFEMRFKSGKPFIKPLMPAGDYDQAVNYLTNKGFVYDMELSTSFWNKKIKLLDLIIAIRVGSFSVFAKGLSENEREGHAQKMKSYCLDKGYSLNEDRFYPAQMRVVILIKT